MSDSDSPADKASAVPSSSETPPATPPAVSVLRRPVGSKIRRPPTQLLLAQRQTAVTSAVASADTEVAEAIAETTKSKNASESEEVAACFDDLELSGVELDCDPVAEVQDEDAAPPAPTARPRNLPHGAVPMLPGLGGGGGILLKPRLLRPRPADAESDSAPAAAAEEEDLPRPRRLRPPGATGPPLPAPASVAATDFLALRKQLRKAAETSQAADFSDHSAPEAAPRPSAAAPSEEAVAEASSLPKPRRPRPPGAAGPSPLPSPASMVATDFLTLRQQLRKTPSPQPVPNSPQSPQSPPSLASLPRLPSDSDGQDSQPPPPPPPPRPPPPKPLIKPRSLTANGERIG